MFYQICLSLQVGRRTVITYKHGTFELPNDFWLWVTNDNFYNLDPDPGPAPWTRTLKTSTLKNPDPEKPGPWKTWETAGYGKMIRRPHIMTYHIMTEQTIWKSSYRGFLGRQKIYFRIKMNSEVINK